MFRRLLMGAVLLVASTGSKDLHAERPSVPHPAAPPETAQFAFLIGDWDCATRFLLPDGSGYQEGKARWTGYYILDGWAIQDDWIGYPEGGGEQHGTNVRSFNPETKRWDNRWLAAGSLQWKYYEAQKQGDTMVMVGGEGTDPRGAFLDRNVFHDIGPDGWRWRKDRSYDGGETWIEGIGLIEATRRESRPFDQVAVTSRFDFRSNLWINLNHFLHKLAGGESRRPVAADQLQLVDSLSPADREVWDRAVQYYAAHHAKNDIRRDDTLHGFKKWVVQLGPDEPLVNRRFDPDWLAILEEVKPIYREHFWPSHDAWNRRVIADRLPAIQAIEDVCFERLAVLAAEEWPEGPIRVDVSYYANWAGAYTTNHPTHVVISSADIPAPDDWVELMFHEPSHALIGPGWSPIGEMVDEAAAARKIDPPGQLWHAILFYLSGRVVQDARADQGEDCEPYMFRRGVFGSYHQVLREQFEPYVRGEIDLRTAVNRVIDALATSG